MLSSPWPRGLVAMGEVQPVGSWLSPSAEPSGPLTATARRAAVSGQAEFSAFYAVAERIPQICCEDQHRTLLVFRVTDGHDTRQAGGHFHAVAARGGEDQKCASASAARGPHRQGGPRPAGRCCRR